MIKTVIQFYNIRFLCSFLWFEPFETHSYHLPHHLLVWPLQAIHSPFRSRYSEEYTYLLFTMHWEVQFGGS